LESGAISSDKKKEILEKRKVKSTRGAGPVGGSGLNLGWSRKTC